MRRILLLPLILLASAAQADRLINTPRGGKLPYGTVRAEYLYEPTTRHNSYGFLGIGITTAFDLEIRTERIENEGSAATFDFGYNVNAPLTDFAPGISLGVLDVLDQTQDGRRYYLAITSRQAASDMLIGGEALEMTLGFTVGAHDSAFVGVSLPFSEAFRLIAEHDGYRITAGFELRPRDGIGLRALFRPNETLVGVQVLTRF